MSIADLVPPLVTEADMRWAIDQRPANAALGAGRSATALAPQGPALDWRWFVQREMRAFERYFAGECKTRGDWSRLWRRGWWPKAEPWKFVPRPTSPASHPYWKVGSAGFRLALCLATPVERKLFEKIGVAQFRPDDPRVVTITQAIEGQRGAAGSEEPHHDHR